MRLLELVKLLTYLPPIIHHLQQYNPHTQRSDGTFGCWNLVLIKTEDILDILGSRQNRSTGKENVTSRISELRRQNLLFSATLNEKVNHHAQISLEDAVMIGLNEKSIVSSQNISSSESKEDERSKRIGNILNFSNEEYKLPAQLVQRYVKVPYASRLVVLLSILKNLFEREKSQKAFKMEKSALLLSTNVAARGLDFPKVRCIIQYDSPREATEYLHSQGEEIGKKCILPFGSCVYCSPW